MTRAAVRHSTCEQVIPEAYSEPTGTSKMELFAKIVKGWKPLLFFAKNCILDVRLGFEYISEFCC